MTVAISSWSVSAALSARVGRRAAPLVVVDVSVPRNVDPEVNNLDGLFVYDIDDLQSVAAGNAADVKPSSSGEGIKSRAGGAGVTVSPICARTTGRGWGTGGGGAVQPGGGTGANVPNEG